MKIAQYNLFITNEKDAYIREFVSPKRMSDIPIELFDQCLSFLETSEKMNHYEWECDRFIWISLAYKNPARFPFIKYTPNPFYLERFSQSIVNDLNNLYNESVVDFSITDGHSIKDPFQDEMTCLTYLKGKGRGPLRRQIFEITTLSIRELDIKNTLNFNFFTNLKRVELAYGDYNCGPTLEQINQIPLTVNDLNICRIDTENINLSRLNLNRLLLCALENLTVEQWNQISTDLEILILENQDIKHFSFSRFNLKRLDLIFYLNIMSLTPKHLTEIRPTLKELTLRFPSDYTEQIDGYNIRVNAINLSHLKHLEKFNFSQESYTPFLVRYEYFPANLMVQSLSSTIKILQLSTLNLNGVTWNRFVCLEELSLIDCSEITPADIEQFPKTITHLKLVGFDFIGWDISLFAPFTSLKTLDLENCENTSMIESTCESYPEEFSFDLITSDLLLNWFFYQPNVITQKV